MSRAPNVVLRIAVILAVAYLASLLIDVTLKTAETLSEAQSDAMMLSLLAGLLLAYALLIAVPFVPGVEIGIALLLMRGAEVAPAVYLATVAGLLLAFGIGRLIPHRVLASFLRDLRLRRAADMVQSFCDLPPDARLQMLNTSLPRPLALLLVRARYLTLAGVLNLPGNTILGGGGGLLMLAGVTGTFRPLPTVIMVVLAVLPVPFAV